MQYNPVDFAIAEWKRYAAQMDALYDPSLLKFAPFTPALNQAMHIEDPFWEDAYCIQVENGQGTLFYSNARSAVLGVYHLLREAGCAFLRPGQAGEIIPKVNLHQLHADISLRAAYRHRCICIEGSDSLDNVLDIIDYAPKAGYNAYYTQFMEAYTFFERWYTHMDNPLRAPGEFTEDMAREMQRMLVQEIRRRGLIYHAVGHGWTCEPFGIPGKHWADDGFEATPEQAKHLALLNGKRGIRGGIGLNTNLCYSNPETRQIMVQAIGDYALAHPEIDILHVWLADENNNYCECDACRKATPSDWYVQLLNEIDAHLTTLGSPIRIAFLIYYELLYPPKQMKLNNENRFILMYAPITRSFSSSYKGVPPRLTHKPFELNHVYFERDLSENLGFLAAWRQLFKGDGFDFDYHLCSACFYDPGHMTISRVLYDDINALKDLQLNGMINCQLQRIAMPHGFGLFIGGQTLCNPTLDYDAALKSYFEKAFGPRWEIALDFCQTISRLFPMESIMNTDARTAEDEKRVQAVKEHCQRTLLPDDSSLCIAQARSWRNLRYWQSLLPLFCDYCTQLLRWDQEGVARTWQKLETFAWQHEADTQSDFDTYYFLHALRPR